MNIQLNMFSSLYYSTLGYDAELIDYLSFIDDSFIHSLFPNYLNHTVGRKPNNPVTLLRMHFLYFIKPEFISFRQMCEELRKPKHQDYRNFLGIQNLDVPDHSALSRFRSQLGLEADEKALDEISKSFINQACKMEGFLNLMIGSLDSKPIYANVGGFKKDCTCKNIENCTCPPRFSDPDAKVGRQRIKVNQNRYFIGYRQNTIIVPSSQGPMPLISVIVDAKTSDSKMLLPCLDELNKMDIQLAHLIADMAYIDGDDKIKAMKEHQTAVCTQVKKNMVIPENCNEKGQLICPEEHVLEFVEFDKETLNVTYCGKQSICSSCFRYGTCDREFTYSFEENPQFYGPVAQESMLQKSLLNFRKQSELNFAIESNTLDRVSRHRKLVVRGITKVKTYLRLADIFRLIIGMIHHAQKHFVPKGRNELLRRLAEQTIYERTIVHNYNLVA